MAERWLANMQANAQTSGNRYARASHESVPGLEDERNQPTVRRSANRRHTHYPVQADTSPERNSAPFRSGNERLYEAYNELHALAQEFGKTFDAPAILVVGHQTDGKSGARPTCLAIPGSACPAAVVRQSARVLQRATVSHQAA